MRRITTYILAFTAVAALFTRCTGKPETTEPEQKECILESFSIPAAKNGLRQTLNGVIDARNRTVTIKTTEWMERPDALTAEFGATGTVTVNGFEQTSGNGTVDFFETEGNVIYTVTSDDGTSADYTVTIDSPMFSGLPVVCIDVDGGKEITQKTETYYGAAISVADPHEPAHMFASRTGIRGRGNTSWQKPKKSWRIHFDDPKSVLGLAPARSWVLLANWQDPTLVMNETAFELGRRFGLPYTNNSRFVELWINGTYRGNYQLTEQIQATANRIAIDEENGGFVAELDTYYDSEPKFRSALFKLPVLVKDPETVQTIAIKVAFDAFENALFDGTWQNLADENSFIDYMLVTEIVRNPELSHPKSMFIYRRDASSKICFGPLWDFDWSYAYAGDGSFNYFQPKNLTLLYGPHRQETTGGIGFVVKFYADKGFRKRYKERWNAMKASGQIGGIVQYVEMLSQSLMKSQKYNFERWPNGKVYQEQIVSMKLWLAERITVLDREINKF